MKIKQSEVTMMSEVSAEERVLYLTTRLSAHESLKSAALYRDLGKMVDELEASCSH
jgi:hypothetical protein